MKASADQIVAAAENRLTTIVFPEADLVAESDRFTVVETLDALLDFERERVCCVLLRQGPYPIPGRSRCREQIELEVVTRHRTTKLARARMLRDAPRIRQAERSISSAVIGDPAAAVPGDPSADVSGPYYDYASLVGEGWVLMSTRVVVSYEAEV